MALPPDRPLQEGQPTSAREKRERRRRKDAGHPRWEDRDYYVLKWIGTQGVIRFDQLRQLLGRESEDLDDWHAVLSPSATRNAIDRWEAEHLVNSAHIMPREPKYSWLSNAGLQFVELELPHYRPRSSDMPFMLACNQVRLHLELQSLTDVEEFGDFSECNWVSQRELQQDSDPERAAHISSTQFWTQKRGTLAIEVVIESDAQTEATMQGYAQGKLGDYSEVWYFALSSQLPLLDATRAQLQRTGVNVSTIYTFNADTILIPPPKRTRKDKG